MKICKHALRTSLTLIRKSHTTFTQYFIDIKYRKYARIICKLSLLIFNSRLQTQNYPAHSVAGVRTLNCELYLGLYALSCRAFLLLSDPLLFSITSLLLTHFLSIYCLRFSKTHLFIAFFIQCHDLQTMGGSQN